MWFLMNNNILFSFNIIVFIEFGNGCISEDSREKSNCGCQSYKFMKEKGKRFYCERTKNYRHVFLNSNFPEDLISIQLSQSEITEITSDFFPYEVASSLKNVLELSLSNNGIIFIATGAFEFFKNLKSLNLSNNKIGRLHKGIFKGLSNLRKLFLNYNNFPIIPNNVFNYLTSLKQLVVRSDYLICNCLMKDFFRWYQNQTALSRLKLVGNCQYPAAKRNQRLRVVAKKVDSLNCDHPTNLPLFEIQPNIDQLVFAGDERMLYCEGTDLSESNLVWSLNGGVVNSTIESFNENTIVHNNQSTVASYLNLNLSPRYSGKWECNIASNVSRDTRAFRLIVIDKKAAYCNRELVDNDFGSFHWPQAVSGIEVALNCTVPSKIVNKSSFVAKRSCLAGGVWSAGDYSQCQFTDHIARYLVKLFAANQNNSSMKSACNTTADDLQQWQVASVSGMKLLLRLMEECKPFIGSSVSISEKLLDLVSISMTSSPVVAMASQRSVGASNAIAGIVDEVFRNVDLRKFYIRTAPNLAASVYERSTPMTCNVTFAPSNTTMHCNRTRPGGLPIQPGVYVPLDGATATGIRIVVYRNSRLFPSLDHGLLLNLSDFLELNKSKSINREIEAEVRPLVFVSRVYSVLTADRVKLNCSKHLLFVFQTDEAVLLRNNQHFLMVWAANRWHKVGEKDCQPVFSRPNNVTLVKCYRMGTYAIVKNLDERIEDQSDTASMLLHPAVYITASLLSFILLIIIVTYVIFPSLFISSEARQALINCCLHMLLATLMFVIAVKRTNNKNLCYACGILLHYSSLSILIWLLLIARIMGKEMVASQQPLSSDPKPKRPIIRFYLLACGIPIIICGITAAAKIQNYHDEENNYCWLSWETSIYAFYVPAALIVISCLLVLLRILATLSSDVSVSTNQKPPHATRNDVTELTPLHHTSSVRTSTLSVNKQIFNEQKFGCRLRGVALTLLLYVVTWVFAAFVVISPEFEETSMSDENFQYFDDELTASGTNNHTLSVIFSCLYALCASSIAFFLFHHHLSSRTDVAMRWKLLLCFCKRQNPLDAVACHDNEIDVIANVKPSKKNKTVTTTSVTEDMTLESALPATPREGTPNQTSNNPQNESRSAAGDPDQRVIEEKTATGNTDLRRLQESSIRREEHSHHLDNKRHVLSRKPVKLTNLQLHVHRCPHSSVTDHSPDESLNMHTVPISLQQAPKLDNTLLSNRYKKIRKNLEARRNQKRKLRVLREYAQDPLTSNDEKMESHAMPRSQEARVDLEQCPMDKQMIDLLAIREYEKANDEEKLNVVNVKQQKYRPLLISSPRRKEPPPSQRKNPNLASSYSRGASSKIPDKPNPLTNRVEGVSSWGSPALIETGKSHNYLTAGAMLSNPFHIPSKPDPPHFRATKIPPDEDEEVALNRKRSETRM